MQALQEVQPAFGATLASLESYRLHGMLDYGPRYGHLLSSCRTLVEQARCYLLGGGGHKAGATGAPSAPIARLPA